MRRLGFLGIVLLLLAPALPATATCSHKIYGNGELGKTELSIPVTLIAKLIESAKSALSNIAPDIKVTLRFDADMEFRLDCGCRPCCQAPQKQVASLTVSASVQAFGGKVVFVGRSSAALDGVPDPAPGKECGLSVALVHRGGEEVPAIGVDLSLGGFVVKTEKVRMNFWAIPACECTEDPRCFANNAPIIRRVIPSVVDLKKGERATITVWAADPDGNLAPFSQEIYTKESGYLYLPVTLVEATYNGGWEGMATYVVEFPKEGEQLQGFARISAWDDCGLSDTINVPVRLLYPPMITQEPQSGWFDSEYRAFFTVSDPNLGSCDPHEAITLWVKDVSCGRYYLFPEVIRCNMAGFGSAVVVFYPEPDCCSRSFTLQAQDFSGQQDKITVQIPDRPVCEVKVSPHELRLRPGQTALAVVTCDGDPDGDTVTLTEVVGPGSFFTQSGRGKLSAYWTWTVPDKALWSPHMVAVFEALYKCGSSSQAGLLLTVLVPPFASGANLWVRRGGTASASIYVYDPDTPPEALKFNFDAPAGIRVQVISIEQPPSYYGTYHGYIVRIEVTVDQRLCDGVYTVPFTVRDPDGGSSSATLYVHVRGNQPPQVVLDSREEKATLEGTATVTLTPNGAELSPAVMRVKITDLDGDKVYVAGCFPPTYAVNLTLAYGSLNVTYWPRLDDQCRVRQETPPWTSSPVTFSGGNL